LILYAKKTGIMQRIFDFMISKKQRVIKGSVSEIIITKFPKKEPVLFGGIW